MHVWHYQLTADNKWMEWKGASTYSYQYNCQYRGRYYKKTIIAIFMRYLFSTCVFLSLLWLLFYFLFRYITCGTTQYFHYISYNTSVFLQIYSISKMSHIRVHFHFFLSSAPSLTSLSAARDNAKSKLFFDQKSLSHSCSLARQRWVKAVLWLDSVESKLFFG